MLQQQHTTTTTEDPSQQPLLRRGTRIRKRIIPYRTAANVPSLQQQRPLLKRNVKIASPPPPPPPQTPPLGPAIIEDLIFGKKIPQVPAEEEDWSTPDKPKVTDPLVLESLIPIPAPPLDSLEQVDNYNPIYMWVNPTVYERDYIQNVLQKVRKVAQSFGDLQPNRMTDQLQDYLKELKAMESRQEPFLERSPQIGKRKDIVIYIANICHSQRWTLETLVHGIYLYDRFADAHDIEERQIYLVALTCLVIAAKLDENDDRTPDMELVHKRHLPRKTDGYFKLFLAMEVFVLRFFEFKIIVPTVVNFLDCYLLFALDGYGTDIFFELYKYQNKRSYTGNYGDLMYKVYTYTWDLCRIVALETPSQPHQASLVAASILLFARRECHMNFWTSKLGTVTGCEFSDITHCLKTVVQPCVENYGSSSFEDKPRRDPVLVNFFNFK